jgi:ATP-dependent Zn protease
MTNAQPSRIQLKRRTAYHEAGHAVIARVLTLPSGHATVSPDFDEGSAGHSITPDPYDCIYEWEKRGKVRHSEAAWHARIIAFMAGVEAEKELLAVPDHSEFGDESDRIQIDRMASGLDRDADWKKVEPRLRAMTRLLVRRHKALIERTAEALLKAETISAEALDKIIGRSVNDVKVNAPMLLEMHRR